MNSKIFFLFILLFLLLLSCRNDKLAPAISRIDLQKITELSEGLPEISGIIFQNEQYIYGHNDSGDGPFIYEISLTEKNVNKKVKILNAENIDWEDLTQDQQNIYVGDFGNNLGNRVDLKIYKFPKSDVQNLDSVQAEVINFSFSDQLNFEASNTHNFDCEAIISIEDSLFLFSKNRQDLKTKMYSLPKIAGTHIAKKHSEFNVDGLITGADINSDKNVIILLGYQINDLNFDPFIWFFHDFNDKKIFEGKSEQLLFPFQSQMEAVSFGKNLELYFVPESESGETQFIYKIDGAEYLN